MKRVFRIFYGCIFLALLSGVSISAYAVKLGSLKLYSGMSEPLRAEIDLLEVDTADIEKVTVDLANRQAFAQAGMERKHFITNLDFNIENIASGPVVRITTRIPIQESYLAFLLEAKSAVDNSVDIREYTALFDLEHLNEDAQIAATNKQTESITEPAYIADSREIKPMAQVSATTKVDIQEPAVVASKEAPPVPRSTSIVKKLQELLQRYGGWILPLFILVLLLFILRKVLAAFFQRRSAVNKEEPHVNNDPFEFDEVGSARTITAEPVPIKPYVPPPPKVNETIEMSVPILDEEDDSPVASSNEQARDEDLVKPALIRPGALSDISTQLNEQNPMMELNQSIDSADMTGLLDTTDESNNDFNADIPNTALNKLHTDMNLEMNANFNENLINLNDSSIVNSGIEEGLATEESAEQIISDDEYLDIAFDQAFEEKPVSDVSVNDQGMELAEQNLDDLLEELSFDDAPIGSVAPLSFTNDANIENQEIEDSSIAVESVNLEYVDGLDSEDVSSNKLENAENRVEDELQVEITAEQETGMETFSELQQSPMLQTHTNDDDALVQTELHTGRAASDELVEQATQPENSGGASALDFDFADEPQIPQPQTELSEYAETTQVAQALNQTNKKVFKTYELDFDGIDVEKALQDNTSSHLVKALPPAIAKPVIAKVSGLDFEVDMGEFPKNAFAKKRSTPTSHNQHVKRDQWEYDTAAAETEDQSDIKAYVEQSTVFEKNSDANVPAVNDTDYQNLEKMESHAQALQERVAEKEASLELKHDNGSLTSVPQTHLPEQVKELALDTENTGDQSPLAQEELQSSLEIQSEIEQAPYEPLAEQPTGDEDSLDHIVEESSLQQTFTEENEPLRQAASTNKELEDAKVDMDLTPRTLDSEEGIADAHTNTNAVADEMRSGIDALDQIGDDLQNLSTAETDTSVSFGRRADDVKQSAEVATQTSMPGSTDNETGLSADDDVTLELNLLDNATDDLAEEDQSKELPGLTLSHSELDAPVERAASQQVTNQDVNNKDYVKADELIEMDFFPSRSGAQTTLKIDLARMYINLGDIKSAQEMLNEVLDEGTPEQQNIAQKLLLQL